MSFSLPIPDLWFKVTVVLLISENSDSEKGEQPLLPRVGCIQALEKGALCSGLLAAMIGRFPASEIENAYPTAAHQPWLSVSPRDF